MKTLNKVFATLAMSVLLSACGGSDGGSSDGGAKPQTTITGKAIDGYVEGATVFLDLNYNGKLDGFEVPVITGPNGDYTITTDSICSDYAPIVVDVPVGAIDADFGVVEKPYTMISKPGFIKPTDGALHVTPFTTAVFSAVMEKVQADGLTSCEEVINNPELRAYIMNEVSAMEYSVANRYNIEIEDIGVDYIATNNRHMTDIGAEIVKGLSRTAKESLAFAQLHPGKETHLEYYMEIKSGEFEYTWFREEKVSLNNTYWSMGVWEVDGIEEANVVVQLQDAKTVVTVNDGVNTAIGHNHVTETLYGAGDDSVVFCGTTEQYIVDSASDLVINTLSINNSVRKENFTIAECASVVYEGAGTNIDASRILYTDTSNELMSNTINLSSFAPEAYINTIVADIKASADVNDVDFTYLDSFDYSLDAVEGYDAGWWMREELAEYFDRAEIKSIDSNGTHMLRTFNNSGTTITECGDSWDTMQPVIDMDHCVL